MNKSPNKELGSKGERRAAAFLVAAGFEIMATNLRLCGGEIDILARAPEGTIAVVEVKTRSGDFVRPQANITHQKLMTLRRLAHSVADRYPEANVRVDVIEVTANINHLVDVLA